MYRHIRTWIKNVVFYIIVPAVIALYIFQYSLILQVIFILVTVHMFSDVFRGYRNGNGLSSSWWITSNTVLSPHKKWSCLLKTFSVNVTKSTDSCRFGQMYWRNFKWKTFFLQCIICYPQLERSSGISLFGKMNQICSKLTNKSEQP